MTKSLQINYCIYLICNVLKFINIRKVCKFEKLKNDLSEKKKITIGTLFDLLNSILIKYLRL